MSQKLGGKGHSTNRHKTAKSGHRSGTTSADPTKAAALGEISGNARVAPNIPKEERKSVSSHSVQPIPASATRVTKKVDSTAKPYVPIRIALRRVTQENGNEIEYLLKKWKNGARDAPRPSALLMSHMPVSGDKAKDKTEQSEEVELDFLKVFTIDFSGTFFGANINVSFGDSDATQSFPVLMDSGAALSWVNKKVYEEKVANKGKRLKVKISLGFAGVAQQITGELYENKVSCGTDESTVEKQVFAVVDEKHQPMVRVWREKFKILGLLGIERKANVLEHLPDLEIAAPSYTYQLLKKKAEAACILGLDIKIPRQANTSRSGGDLDSIDGELHLGGFKRSAFAPNEIKWVRADKIELGPDSLFVLKQKFSYKSKGENKVSDEHTTVIDSGSTFSYIPNEVLKGYIDSIDKDQNIFSYDDVQKGHYISKRNFKKLTDITFNFDGADIHVPRKEIVIPYSIFKQWEPEAKNRLYLSLRTLPEGSKASCILGYWWMKNYYFVFDGANARIGIAEVKGKTDYVYKELRELM